MKFSILAINVGIIMAPLNTTITGTIIITAAVQLS